MRLIQKRSAPKLEFPDSYDGTLCHPDSTKSCAACCGVYNHHSPERAVILERVRVTTHRFEHEVDAGDMGKAEKFAAEHHIPPNTRLMEELPACHFVGQLETGAFACLVHPLQHDGWDARDLGVHDKAICGEYLCASHELMKEQEKWLAIRAIQDSYLYGLVITDVTFVRQLFDRSADLNASVVTHRCLTRPEAVAAAAKYFALKLDWPWAAADGIFGQIRAGKGLNTPRREPAWSTLGVEPTPWDTIVTCLGTEVREVDELNRARARVRKCVTEFAKAVEGF